MPEAVRSVLLQYVVFRGRARRAEYWWFVLAAALAAIATTVVDTVIGTASSFGGYGLVTGLLYLAVLVPSLAVGARRLHDTGRSGWWQLIGLVPLVGFIVLVVFWAQDSQPDNAYGPSPKHDDAAGTARAV